LEMQFGSFIVDLRTGSKKIRKRLPKVNTRLSRRKRKKDLCDPGTGWQNSGGGPQSRANLVEFDAGPFRWKNEIESPCLFPAC